MVGDAGTFILRLNNLPEPLSHSSFGAHTNEVSCASIEGVGPRKHVVSELLIEVGPRCHILGRPHTSIKARQDSPPKGIPHKTFRRDLRHSSHVSTAGYTRSRQHALQNVPKTPSFQFPDNICSFVRHSGTASIHALIRRISTLVKEAKTGTCGTEVVDRASTIKKTSCS